LAKQQTGDKIYVYTTRSAAFNLGQFETGHKNIRLIRLGKSGGRSNALQRAWNYGLFYLGCFGYLVVKRTRRILYYETISAFPAWCYRRFFNRQTAILIHYHEYTSIPEYEQGMKLTRIFHSLEKWLYPRACWVSHTNPYRMNLFSNDLLPLQISHPQVVPNYPPASWIRPAKKNSGLPVKIVYAGALSLDTMFTRQFAEWVIGQGGKVSWDIYSYNITEEAGLYLKGLNTTLINTRPAVNYEDLPAVLEQYEVGVILYNGHIANYVYNAPNKLFEYLACGLDVWVPDIMIGALEYQRLKTFPKLIALDFTRLESLEPAAAINKEGLQALPPDYICEKAFALLSSEILK
jgi:hypothetical protein